MMCGAELLLASVAAWLWRRKWAPPSALKLK